MGKGRCPVILTSPKDAGFQPPDWTLPGRDAPCGGVAVGAACQPVGAGATGLLLLGCEVRNPAQSCGGGWKPDGAGEQHDRVVDLLDLASLPLSPFWHGCGQILRNESPLPPPTGSNEMFSRPTVPVFLTISPRISRASKYSRSLLPRFAVADLREISGHSIPSLEKSAGQTDVGLISEYPFPWHAKPTGESRR